MMSVVAYAADSQWPPLPTTGFIFGRPATEQDVDAGNAIFVAKVNGVVIGKPVSMIIPQFAYWTDSAGKKIPVVIVQAEDAQGMRLYGFRDAQGIDHVCTGPEIEVLGTTAPN
jgi:hypothetical protein